MLSRPLPAVWFVVLGYLLTLLAIVSLALPSRSVPFPSSLNQVIVALFALSIARQVIYTLLGSYFTIRHSRRASACPHHHGYHPLVSVLIPAWNEEVGLLRTVHSVLASTYDNLEIIVINDGSTDRSDQLMRAWLSHHKAHAARTAHHIPIIYHYQPNGGKSRALNTGLALANGTIVITIDADSLVEPGTVQAFVNCFADPSVAAAVGTVKIGNTQTLWGLMQRLEYMVGFFFKRAQAVMNSIYVIGGAAGAFRRSVFDTVGVFRTDHITEDLELTLRLQQHGMKIAYAATAVVHTEGASSCAGLLRQRLRWKRGRFDAFAEHRSLFFSRQPLHQPLLGWVVMPTALAGDLQLLPELCCLAITLAYAVVTGGYLPLLLGTAMITALIVVQIAMSERGDDRRLLYGVAPLGGWLLIVAALVELHALILSVWTMARRRTIAWQVWQRVGLAEATHNQEEFSGLRLRAEETGN